MTTLALLSSRQSREDMRICDALVPVATSRSWDIERAGFESMDRRTGHGRISRGRADELYRKIHRQQTLLVSTRPVEAERHGQGGTIALGRLLRYKAAFAVVESLTELAARGGAGALFDELDAWLESSPSSPADPRVLPLHVFCPREDVHELFSEEGRQRFQRQRRTGGAYVDPDGRPWEVPHANQQHGREGLVVGALGLPRGYHWDVQSRRSRTSLRTLARSHTLERGSHRNVYPDGCVRPDD